MTNAVRSKDTEIVVYLGLGSNLGNREANLREAIERIRALGLKIKKESSIYETEPFDFHDQPWFLNQVIETSIPIAKQGSVKAEALLSELLQIEQGMGRRRQIANGPRVIDIDLLLFGDMVSPHSKEDEEWPHTDGTGLVVPHPRLHLRRFVVTPLCELAPDLVHPVLKKTFREFLASLDDKSRVRLFEQR